MLPRTMPKRLLLLVGGSCLVVYTLYYMMTQSLASTEPRSGPGAISGPSSTASSQPSLQYDVCTSMKKYPADIETVDTFSSLEL